MSSCHAHNCLMQFYTHTQIQNQKSTFIFKKTKRCLWDSFENQQYPLTEYPTALQTRISLAPIIPHKWARMTSSHVRNKLNYCLATRLKLPHASLTLHSPPFIYILLTELSVLRLLKMVQLLSGRCLSLMRESLSIKSSRWDPGVQHVEGNNCL